MFRVINLSLISGAKKTQKNFTPEIDSFHIKRVNEVTQKLFFHSFLEEIILGAENQPKIK